MSTNFGFIGIGNMGKPMALNLLKSNKVYVYDIDKAHLTELIQEGAIACDTIADLCRNVSCVIMMLQTGDQVEEVCTGDDGVFLNIPSGSIIIDCSTIDIETSIKLHNCAVKKKIKMLDAPVSGGVAAAKSGSLTFMVGGNKKTFNEVIPIFSAMGKKIIYAGKAGNGQAAKICNNMLLGITMIGVCETFILAEKLGVDALTFFNISKNASSRCWTITDYAPVPNVVPSSPSNNNFKPGFTSQLMLKDLNLSQSAAKLMQTQTIMGKAATELYKQFVSEGNAELDFSGIINMLRDYKFSD